MRKKGDFVFVKALSSKVIIRFGKKGKLSLWFIASFEILDRVGAVAYGLVLSPQLSSSYNVFRLSMLQKYKVTLSCYALPPPDIREDMTYVQ